VWDLAGRTNKNYSIARHFPRELGFDGLK
jgi:hypothetical protein